MKAGIYKRRDNGRLGYIAKDRSLRAYMNAGNEIVETTEEHRKESRVTSRNKDQHVEFEDGGIADRVADVPNGCTDPKKAIAEVLAKRYREAFPTLAEAGKALRNVDYAEVEARVMRLDGYRPCHAQSARKHRRRGHHVVGGNGKYWWRAVA